MKVSTWQSWVGAWKELKQWVMQKSSGVPDGAQEGAFYYDTDKKLPQWYDGTNAHNFDGVTNHNDLDGLQGGEPSYYGHTTGEQTDLLNNAGDANGVAVLDETGHIPINNIPSIAYIYKQEIASAIWGPITNPFARPCSVELIDSTGNEYEGDITHNSDFSELTITLSAPMSGVAVLN